ncbi:MAG: DUF4094 domain-containing protein [Gammaproteobacteria bacterium]|nr:DUF4094 domain-containing protein [Gammaproteobacteria bacterium]
MEITITHKAIQALDSLVSPLDVEMELYFSCLIRKQVTYPASHHKDARPIQSGHPNLNLYFRPVMTKQCVVGESSKTPGLIPFPMQDKPGLMPKWFVLDHDGKGWVGDFGYADR